MAGEKRRVIGKWAAVGLVLVVVVYPLSYAPVVRYQEWQALRSYAQGHLEPDDADDSGVSVFGPIDWLIDETPARKPLFLWARLWGVETTFRANSILRNMGMM